MINGIPDFISGNSQPGFAPVLRLAKKVDWLAPIYESRLWYQFSLNLGGARHSSLDSIARFHAESLQGITGSVLDVACGPATYGRRIASPDRNVYGVDISTGMLQKGIEYIAREHIAGVYLARARVEELPFENAVFDGAICSGALHLFPDTIAALREIARTLKLKAPLTVQTFITGNSSLNRLLRLLKVNQEVHRFEIPELQQSLGEAGFEEFRSKVDGIVLTFSARKGMSHA
jgi:SAM-dependent methyltransferase